MDILLMDLASRNLIDSFSTENEALAFVRAAIDESGLASVSNWSLGRLDRSVPPIAGPALAERAKAAAPA